MTSFTPTEQTSVNNLAAYDKDRYDPTSNPTGLAGDGYKTNAPKAWNDTAVAANAVARISNSVDAAAVAVIAASAGAPSTTSATALAIATGTLAFTVADSSKFISGMWVKAFSQATPGNYVWGVATVTSGTAISLAATITGGSGTVSDWKLIPTGPNGATTGISSLLDDTAPKLGADLNTNGNDIIVGSGDKIVHATGSLGAEMAGAPLNNALLGPTNEKMPDLGSVMNTVTPDCTVASHFRMVLAGNIALALPTTLTVNTVRGITLQVKQATTGVSGEPFGITWPASVKWPGGTASTMTAAPDATDIYILRAALDGSDDVVYAAAIYGQGFVGL